MGKLFMYIKKFFAIIFSLIFSIFRDDKKIDKEKDTKEEKTSNKLKKAKSIGRIRDDEENKKSISNKNKLVDEKDILYNAKIDIQKLMTIQKNIINLEYQINTTNNLEDLYILQKELQKEKDKLESIAVFYDKVSIDLKVVKDIKLIVSDSRKLIKDEEKNLDKKIYKEKNKKEEQKQEVQKEKKSIEEKQKEIKVEHEVKEKDIKETRKKEDQQEKNIVKMPILELITIKEITELIPEIKLQKENESKEKEEQKTKNSVKVEKKDKKIINKTKQVVSKENINVNINKIKNNNKSKRIAMISLILAKATSLIRNANPNSLLMLNQEVAVKTTLNINNEIRKARSLNNKKVKKLKLDKVIKKVGNNPRNMIKAIISNSLSELRKLKAELKQYDMCPELLEALNSINEIELELIQQIQELENINTNTRLHSR